MRTTTAYRDFVPLAAIRFEQGSVMPHRLFCVRFGRDGQIFGIAGQPVARAMGSPE